jgi:AcrR family transcriptional regulator
VDSTRDGTRSPDVGPRPDGADGPASTTTSGERVRATRADAVRNRAALLAAARAVFREQGLAAQMDDIAARAGLGVGTLYRHFPTRDALLEVMTLERHHRVLGEARAALLAADPWEGLSAFLWRLAEWEAEDRAIVDVLLDAERRLDVTPFYAELRGLVDTLAGRAQAAGQMRTDVSGMDAVTAICTLAQGHRDDPRGDRDGDRDGWQRLVRVLLDGLRVRC